MTQNCYVKVNNSHINECYDVGPFADSGNPPTSDSESAISWIYKQIGIIKTHKPDANLIKHRWNYHKDDFMGPSADIKVEIDGITFEIFNLLNPERNNTIGELATENHIPSGFTG